MNKKYELRSLAEGFILYKQRLGYVYETPYFYLMNYVRYVEEGRTGDHLLDKESVKGYLDTLAGAPGSLYGSTAVLREFGRHLIKQGYRDVYIMPPKTVALPTPEPPYFFTDEEIKHFFNKCDSIKPNLSFKGRELALPAMFRLLYCCGMRCKEVRTLLIEDVHIDAGFLDVKQSKGAKSRRIYISSELSEYLKKFESSISFLFPNRKYFFPSRESCYGTGAISQNFRRIWKQAYPDFILGSRPRAYDFRYPHLNKIRTFRQKPDNQRKSRAKGSDNIYRFIARTPQNMDKLPSLLRHFLGVDLSLSSSSVAKAFASCSVVMSK